MLTKEPIAKDKSIDNTLDLMQDGYLFIKNRIEKYQSNLFETHLMGEKAICMSGEEAAKLFYNPELFERNDAAPKRIQKTLFGENAIQTMDGIEHIHRKALFISLLTPVQQKRLGELMMEKMEASIDKWIDSKNIILFDETKKILCQVACQWAEVPLQESEIESRANDFSLMIDAFGGVGPRYWKGKMTRYKSEEWIRGIIEDVRSGRLKVQEDSVLYTMTFHKNIDGRKMDAAMAAIELINVLRPIVAISTFITFAALALYEHPECKEKLILDNNNYREMFVQEVRRYYPFTPLIGARVKKNFILDKYELKKGMLVLLDVYGINHDPSIWINPDEFNPERFSEWKGGLYDFIPQGGGEPFNTHRCPGEGVTVEIIKESLNFLVNKIDYEVPKQDLSYSMARIPTLPESGFIISNIKRKV